MNNNQTLIGLDCGASYTKVRIYQANQIIFQKDDYPGINMDLLSSDSFTFLKDFQMYVDAQWAIALAGIDSVDEITDAKKIWEKALSSQNINYQLIHIVSDIELILWAGSKEGVGISLIAGTGSNCFGRDSFGHTHKTGGMSHLLSDEGSGYELGSKCLHLITKMADGRLSKTDLLDRILNFYQQETIVDLKNYLLTHPHQKAEIARCATLILDIDSSLIDSATSELALMVKTVNQKLITTNQPVPNTPSGEPITMNQEPITNNSSSLPVYLAGSLFKSKIFTESLKEKLPNVTVSFVTPLDGILNFANQ